MTPTCRRGKHAFQVIYRAGNDMEEDVVRWCEECGGVVVDVDYDGRTNPGAVCEMRFPRVTLGLTTEAET